MVEVTKQNLSKVSFKAHTKNSVRINYGVQTKSSDPIFGDSQDYDKGDAPIKEVKKYQSNQLLDPFDNEYTASSKSELTILKPPFNPHTIRRLPNENNTLRQCIDAMVTNIESNGYRLDYIGEDGKENSKEVLAEKDRLSSFLDMPNGSYSLIEFRERLRRDLETFGYAFAEVSRDALNNIITVYHVPAQTVRLTTPDVKETDSTKIFRRNGISTKVVVKRRFRRYVQEFSGKKVYFKEFGDERSIDPNTGKEDANLGIVDSASELIHINLYDPNTVYGMPRWINQLPNILGSRESELTNLDFFKNNAIPSMAVLVSGAMLTEESVQAVQDHFDAAKGRESMQRVMVLEASADDSAGSVDGNIPTPKLEIENLSDSRQKDALFQEYDKSCSAKIRSSFRLPPLFVGRAEDYTRATAQTSLVVAEAQVFLPERNKIDDMFNNFILADSDGFKPKYWSFRSNPARLIGGDSIVDAIKDLSSMGGITPNIAVGITNELFDLDIRRINSPWGNYPFEMVMELLRQGKLEGVEDIVKEIVDTMPEESDKDSKTISAVDQAIKKPFEIIEGICAGNKVDK